MSDRPDGDTPPPEGRRQVWRARQRARDVESTRDAQIREENKKRKAGKGSSKSKSGKADAKGKSGKGDAKGGGKGNGKGKGKGGQGRWAPGGR